MLVLDCGTLNPPNNGTVTVTGRTLGESASYQCDIGFTLNGTENITCQNHSGSAVWDGLPVTCISKLKYPLLTYKNK